MSTFVYPTNAELTEILQDLLPVRTEKDPIFDIMPLENEDVWTILWEQLDNYQGLMSLRGLDGQPGRVSRSGHKQYSMQPGVYGDYMELTETEMSVGRAPGTFGMPINIEQVIMRRQDQLLTRMISRLKSIGWSLIKDGFFSVTSDTGVVHTDTYNVQSYSAATPWSTFATSTPLNDFRNIQLKHRGHSVDFGAAATAYMNRKTFNNLVQNQNSNDFAGRRTQGLNVLVALNLKEANTILQGEDLPAIHIYDEGYLDDNGAFQPYITDGQAIVVGKRPSNENVAAFKMVRNANNADVAPGPYTKVVDWGDKVVPRKIEVHMGFNGGPVIYFPSAIVKMTV